MGQLTDGERQWEIVMVISSLNSRESRNTSYNWWIKNRGLTILSNFKRSNSSGVLTSNIHRKDWHWSWSSNTLATWCEELTHWKRPWCWERLKARGEGDRGWDGWMASLTQWTWVWANSGRQRRTGKPIVLQSMGSQRVRHAWATEQQQENKKEKHN